MAKAGILLSLLNNAPNQAAENDTERREIALEMGEFDGRRHAEIYAALENE